MYSETITLLELNNRISRAIFMDGGTQQVWVTAELMDVSSKGGHTYMELIQKDEKGTAIAKARAMIWRSSVSEIVKFEETTGQKFCSGIKLKVLASATMHPVFGLSLTISSIDPTFTIGDLLIRRREIIEALQKDGVYDSNRNLPWNSLPQRIAIISAPEAAGYGDFMNHLFTTGIRFTFQTKLFSAMMQGEKTVPTVLKAFDEIENDVTNWDCVVVIRGGGATSDLAAFENYELAYRIATFHIPVIVGIGHERDITVLDYVANKRVKTPTAAADFLIHKWNDQLDLIDTLSQKLIDIVKEKVGSENLSLSYIENNLINYTRNVLLLKKNFIEKATLFIESANSRQIAPLKGAIQTLLEKLITVVGNVERSQIERMKHYSETVKILSPESVLKRGFTITKFNGTTMQSAKISLPPGSELKTIFFDGELSSKIS